jgi:hypothetical protein
MSFPHYSHGKTATEQFHGAPIGKPLAHGTGGATGFSSERKNW